MESIIFVIIGIVAGALIGWLIGLRRKSAELTKLAMLEADSARLKADVEAKAEEISTMNTERTGLISQVQVLSSEIEYLKQQLSDNEKRHDKTVEELKKQHENLLTLQITSLKESHSKQLESLKEQIESERKYATTLREGSDRQWAQKLETLKQEMQKTAAEQLAAKQASLQENNRTQMDELLKPIKEQFSEFKRSVEESKTKNEVNKKEIQSTFEATMKLFQQEQQHVVTSIKEQTERIGSDAANLTKALKGDNKTQGDWGEMILESILETSGLRKDEEFFIQENTKDADGNNFRPDVVVHFPEGRSVVIDSKVSLTAYSDAIAVEDEDQRDRLLKEHARSVRRHVDELAQKDYSKIVSDSIGFVLMFIPNENSYITAMKQQPDLSRYAYQKHIIIISPSNLMMALQLAYNLWQYDRQNKNVEKIVKTASELYYKVAGFSDTFLDVEAQITRLSSSFGKAKTQLYEGSGNVMKRMENLKSLGITPKKQIKSIEESTEE